MNKPVTVTDPFQHENLSLFFLHRVDAADSSTNLLSQLRTLVIIALVSFLVGVVIGIIAMAK